MATKNTIELTDANFRAEAIESDRPVLVDFWAPWCGPCRMLGPTIEQLADQHGATVKVAKMNIDENPETPGALGIASIPTVIVFKGGQAVDRLVGVQPKTRYEEALARATSA